MVDDLLDQAIVATGGRQLRNSLRGLRTDISIGGQIWAMKGWPPEQTFDQILAADTVNEHIINRGTSATGRPVVQGSVSRRGSLAGHGPVESRDKSGSTGFQAAPRVCAKQSVAGPACHRTDTGHGPPGPISAGIHPTATRTLHVTGMPNHTDVQPWTNTATTFPPSLRVSADA